LANQLVELTGESLTTVVIRALKRSLEQERQRRGQKSTSARILEFADRFARGVAQNCRSSDHGRLLYGKDGLPQ
jgi:hypothetical protein